jgi:hypothetical protein
VIRGGCQLLSRELSIGDEEDVIQAYKYIAFAAAALAEDAKAENAHVELLKHHPVFDLMISDSPRLRKPFNSAREKVDCLAADATGHQFSAAQNSRPRWLR